MNKIKTILIGTPEFAERIFRKIYPELLSKDKFEIIAVITAQDKLVGRKQVLTPSPVKKWALENNLPVLQPDKIRKPEWIEKIKKLNPELIILIAYGQIIPQEILDIPSPRQGRGKYGALNIHPSLLPCWRGASPIQATILNGDTETGVSLMIMDAEMDHGPILASIKIQIPNSQTYKKLSEQLADLGANLLIKTLPDYIERKITPQSQDHEKATFCKLIKKEDGKIDWNKSAEEIERQIRAFQEWPRSYTNFNGKILKILEADFENKPRIPQQVEARDKNTDHKIGEVFLDENKNLCVQTGNAILIIKQLQLEGKKPMSARDFLNGHPEIIGIILV
jgi:methionyl-tRNA formyltransferase